MVAMNIAGWVHLIKMHIYMMPQFNMYVACPNIPLVTIPSLKHSITKSMVGPLPLAPHHDYLQYMYHVYLMHRGQNQGVIIFNFLKLSSAIILDPTWSLITNFIIKLKHNVS